MSDREGSPQSTDDRRLFDLIGIATQDAQHRAEIWMDLSFEIARLGVMSTVCLRGARSIVDHLNAAAKLCEIAAGEEVDRSERLIGAMKIHLGKLQCNRASAGCEIDVEWAE